MARPNGITAFVGRLVVLTSAEAVVAAPPPPAKELRNGWWQVRVEARGEGQAYWFGAAVCLAFGAGLGPTAVGRYVGRPWPAGRLGAGLGAATGVAVMLVLGRPDGAPAGVGPSRVGVYAVVGAVAGWQAARGRAAEPIAAPDCGG